MEKRIRVAVADDHERFVRGLELLLPELSGGRATVVATACEAGQATRAVREAVPDLIFVGLRLPPAGGPRAISAIRQAAPQARVLAVTDDDEPGPVMEAVRAGAAGVLSRGADVAELRQPLLAALDGWAVLPPFLLAALVQPSPPQTAVAHLDEADRRLLRLIAGGSSTNEIAGLLHVSERTVKRLTASLLRKIHVSSRTEAAALAGSAGLV
ncbi:response regulator [Actinoplanes aureus]|uniref:Response regulator transcription factor n=1 Tax=Actinoplanes aureus TaxID=2792083 RepID=A0A931G5L7_9ACTN|nr:response regulator transcription factor [Actinoplanes aureus]MBG0568981.1 response regulator transcription factor [Actinoplanes aureus]